MRSRLELTAALCAIVACSMLLALANTSQGDYPRDAAPAMNSMLDGDVRTALAAAAADGQLLPDRAASVRGAGALRRRRRPARVPTRHDPMPDGDRPVGPRARQTDAPPRPAARGMRGGRGALCLVNPLTWEAIRLGHPEELLGGALCVGAVLAALRGRTLPAAVLLGLALATKQWAVIAVLPVLAAAPGAARAPVRGRDRHRAAPHGPARARQPCELLGSDRAGHMGGRTGAPVQRGMAAGATGGPCDLGRRRPEPRHDAGPAAMAGRPDAPSDRPAGGASDRAVVDVGAAHSRRRARAPRAAVPAPLPARPGQQRLLPRAVPAVARGVGGAHAPRAAASFRCSPPLRVYYTIYKAGWTDDVAARNALYLLATVPVGAWVAVRLYAPSLRWRRRAWPLPVPQEPATRYERIQAAKLPPHGGGNLVPCPATARNPTRSRPLRSCASACRRSSASRRSCPAIQSVAAEARRHLSGRRRGARRPAGRAEHRPRRDGRG